MKRIYLCCKNPIIISAIWADIGYWVFFGMVSSIRQWILSRLEVTNLIPEVLANTRISKSCPRGFRVVPNFFNVIPKKAIRKINMVN